MLLANNLKFVRDNKTIFQNINISAASGKIIFVKGRNGSGKTTLLKTLLNILTPFEGEIFWMGKKTKNNLFKLYSSTTLILDKPTSTREITLLENINFWKKISLSTIVNEGVINLLKTLDIYNYINKEVMYLSQGEVKKLELARLIIEQKKLWILDEPYNGLDKNTISLINDTFIDHTANGGIIIFSSHFEPDIRNLEIIDLDLL
tara:strand:- start:1493 stop:2107 length:615 start_codon:yes stop_codon:yes gene_type:complete